ncbi:ACT domain-containing protein [Pelagicoccus albus]|uniref:ACT domain-containing protein n=1 Tax=Pelagicoccus albus TaxID=415222 RepID=A0A7X1BAI1_9BACT|nr:ACT domain-containing protein [Pelagicoccus albus]MBC2607350.1 ACT domain-containing protein [Pelagicoccus albus]
MSGSTDLKQLIQTMSPTLSEESFVIATLRDSHLPEGLKAKGTFYESEGLTVFCEKAEAIRCGIPFDSVFRLITLEVHSSLEAVGFLSHIAQALAASNISCNVVSAYFHDHLLIPESQAELALQVLQRLSRTSR